MLLDNYLNKLLQNQTLRHSEIFIQFLTPPENEELEQLPNSTNDNDDNDDNTNDSNDKNNPNTDDNDNDNETKEEINGNIANGNQHNENENKNNENNDNNQNSDDDDNENENENEDENENDGNLKNEDSKLSESYDIEKRRQKEFEKEMIGVDEVKYYKVCRVCFDSYSYYYCTIVIIVDCGYFLRVYVE